MGNLCKSPTSFLDNDVIKTKESKSLIKNNSNNNINTPLSSGNTRYNNNEIKQNDLIEQQNNNEEEEEKMKESNNNIYNNNIKEDRNDEIERLIEGYDEEKNLSILNDNIYNKKVFELINKIRENPSSYANIIEESIKYIQTKKERIKDSSGEEREITKIIFKKKLKVALTKGEIAFKEAANILRNIIPVEPLIFNKDILIPLPENEEDIKNPYFLRNNGEKVKENTSLEIYFKDLIKDPEISVLLMIVDDNGKNAGKKRNCLLSPNYKYISINSKFIGKTFIAYYSFSK